MEHVHPLIGVRGGLESGLHLPVEKPIFLSPQNFIPGIKFPKGILSPRMIAKNVLVDFIQ